MLHFVLYQLLPWAAFYGLLLRAGRTRAGARWTLPLLFAAGAAAQFALWARSSPGLENPDSLGFWRIGHGLETDLRAILYRPKLYPLFLGLFTTPKAAAFAQCLLKLGMGYWIARAGRALGWRPASISFAAALFLSQNLWLQEPLRIFDTTLFAFLLLGALCTALETVLVPRPARFAGFCLLAGATALCRQVADPLLLAAGAVCLVRVLREAGPRWIPPVSAAAGLCLAVSGALANGLAHGLYVRSVALGVNVYTHYAYYELADRSAPEWDFVEPRLPGLRDTLAPWRTSWRTDMPWSVNALPHHLERALGSTDIGSIRTADSILAGRAFAGMRGQPGRYLAAFGNEALRLLAKCEGGYPSPFLARGASARRLERGITHVPLWVLAAAGCAAWLLGAVLPFLRACRSRSGASGRRNPGFPMQGSAVLALPLFSALGYLALIAAIQIGLYRYGMPAWPLLAIPAVHGIDRLASITSFAEGASRAS